MNPKFSRRQFLGASAALLCLPGRLFAEEKDSENVVLRAAVMSDVHYPGAPDAVQVERFERACKFMYDYSAAQSYPKFDALVVAGDMSNNGTDTQINSFRASLDRCLKPETRRVLCMGNHEFYGGSRELWERTFQMETTRRVEINGYTFLTVGPEKGSCRDGDYQYALPWLNRELESASRKGGASKPVFVIQHYHVTNTVYGSCPPDSWGIRDLHAVLRSYPQVVDFSGHSHYPINDPRSAWQGEYSAFGTSTLSYYEMEGGAYEKFPEGFREAAEFYVMEIHRDNSIVLRPYDLRTNGFFDRVYLLAEPGNIEKFVYTDKRFETEPAPKWKPGASVTVGEITPQSAVVSFPQADGVSDVVHSYNLALERKIDETWQPFGTQCRWSEYYFRDMPTTREVTVGALVDASDYRLSVTPVSCFKKSGSSAISVEFSTPKDPDDTVDKNAPCPDANILDIHFTDSGAVNTPTNGRKTQKVVKKYGLPQFTRDAALGVVAANFDGKRDYLKVPFTAEEYARMAGCVSMGARFNLKEFVPGGAGASVFSNTEGGGYSLEVCMGTRHIDFWCHVNGSYVIASAPFEAGKNVTAYGVYDGTAVILYLDGVEVARKPASGPVTYTHSEKARAFCVAADINGAGEGSNLFRGSVAFARLYNWALTPEQVKNLSKKSS